MQEKISHDECESPGSPMIYKNNSKEIFEDRSRTAKERCQDIYTIRFHCNSHTIL